MNNTNDSLMSDDQVFWIDRINFVNRIISQYGLGLIWLVGNVGLVFNCIVFWQPTFRRSSCSMYFIASSLSQFFTFNFALFNRMLQFGYNVQAAITSLWYCKIRFYLFYIFIAIPRYNLILASVDRYFASSRHTLRRQLSSSKIALRIILGNILFWCLIYIPVLVFYGTENGQCLPQADSYGVFFSIDIAIDSAVLPIILLLIFGLLTIRNIHCSKRHVAPSTTINANSCIQSVNNRISRKDNQLYRMLANQILIFITLNISNPCYLLYNSFTMNIAKSPVRIAAEAFASNMTYILVYVGLALTFPTFLVSSDLFRQEFVRFLQTKILRRPIQTVLSTPASGARGVRSGLKLKPVPNRMQTKTGSQNCS